jgi:PAS domain S-box-containing protein
MLSEKPMTIAILHLEDSTLDAELIAQRLQRAGFAVKVTHAADRAAFVNHLASHLPFDVILSDYQLPDIEGLEALRLARELRPDVPFVFVSGALGEELAVDTLKHGATDYVLKHRLERLAPAIERAVAEARERVQRRRAELVAYEASERLALAQTAGRSGVFDWLIPEGRVVWAPELEDLYGIPRGSFEGTFEDWAKRVVPEDRAAVEAEVQRCMNERREQVEYEFRVVLPNGSRRWLIGKARFFFAPHGVPIRMVGINIDIHDRKLMEEQLRQSEERLKEQDRRKDEFLALLAHELRNPLAPLRNGLQMLRLTSGQGDAAVRAQAIMERQLVHMVRLIDDLMDISRISQNKLHLQIERVSLTDIIECAVETARPLIDAAKHTFTVTLPKAALVLDGDLTRLAQVFSNLLTNSAKYTPPGGRIALEAAVECDELVITVRDSGIGIPADYLPRIFDMFSQADRADERASGGLGIGLALVKALVEMHDGKVAAWSDGPGTGSAFTVHLPLPESVTRNCELPGKTRDHWQWSKWRILVVDDNPDGATSLGLMLELLGNEIYLAHDGFEAIAAAERVRPDLILMDVGMPRLDGLEATAQIRRQPWAKDTTIVALTGWGQDSDRERSREAGCDGHLVKPATLIDLERVLNSLTNGTPNSSDAS